MPRPRLRGRPAPALLVCSFLLSGALRLRSEGFSQPLGRHAASGEHSTEHARWGLGLGLPSRPRRGGSRQPGARGPGAGGHGGQQSHSAAPVWPRATRSRNRARLLPALHSEAEAVCGCPAGVAARGFITGTGTSTTDRAPPGQWGAGGVTEQPPCAGSGQRPHTQHPWGRPPSAGDGGSPAHVAGCGPRPGTSARADARLPGPRKLPTRRTSVSFALGGRALVHGAQCGREAKLASAPSSHVLAGQNAPEAAGAGVPDRAPSLPRQAARAPQAPGPRSSRRAENPPLQGL